MQEIHNKRYIVYLNIIKSIEIYRECSLINKPLTEEAFINEINNNNYIAIQAKRKDDSKRKQVNLIFILTNSDSKYESAAAELTLLINSITNKFFKVGDASELVIVSSIDSTTHIHTKLSSLSSIFFKNNWILYKFSYTIFAIELPKHELVPKHEYATEEEIDEYCRNFYTNKIYFQKILNVDPQCAWLGINEGDCIKIHRLSENTGISISYRYCVKGSI